MASDSEKTYSEDRSKEEARDKEDEDYTKCECNRFCMRNCCCTWNVYWQAAVFSSIIFVYLLLGAAIFMALEGPNEQQRIAEAEINRSRLIQVGQYVVGNLTASGQLNESEAQELVFLISNLSQAFSNLDTSRNWDFAPAVFFSVTVVTTIGYGSIAPVTRGGRLFFVFYALFGIPVALVFLSALGDILNRLLNRLIWRLGKRTKKPWVKIIVLVSSAIVGLCLFVFIPAIIFEAIESWDYFESVYFSFATLTTVGFGDFVPTISLDGSLNGLYRFGSAIWIWLGLAFVSLLIKLIQDSLNDIGKVLKVCKTKCEKRNSKQVAVVKDESGGSAAEMETMVEDMDAGEPIARGGRKDNHYNGE